VTFRGFLAEGAAWRALRFKTYDRLTYWRGFGADIFVDYDWNDFDHSLRLREISHCQILLKRPICEHVGLGLATE
jgi:hypothetical protein